MNPWAYQAVSYVKNAYWNSFWGGWKVVHLYLFMPRHCGQRVRLVMKISLVQIWHEHFETKSWDNLVCIRDVTLWTSTFFNKLCLQLKTVQLNSFSKYKCLAGPKRMFTTKSYPVVLNSLLNWSILQGFQHSTVQSSLNFDDTEFTVGDYFDGKKLDSRVHVIVFQNTLWAWLLQLWSTDGVQLLPRGQLLSNHFHRSLYLWWGVLQWGQVD